MVMRGVLCRVSLKGRLKRKSFYGCLARHAALRSIAGGAMGRLS